MKTFLVKKLLGAKWFWLGFPVCVAVSKPANSCGPKKMKSWRDV